MLERIHAVGGTLESGPAPSPDSAGWTGSTGWTGWTVRARIPLPDPADILQVDR